MPDRAPVGDFSCSKPDKQEIAKNRGEIDDLDSLLHEIVEIVQFSHDIVQEIHRNISYYCY